MSGLKSRNKGASAEREASKLWHEVGFPFARRKLSQYQEKGGIDLENTESFKVQVKSGKKINVWQALREVEEEAKRQEIPLAMIKRDRTDWIVVISWKNFVKVLNPK